MKNINKSKDCLDKALELIHLNKILIKKRTT